MPSSFDETDWLAINTLRCLSIDMVQAANSGHPGAPLGCAPLLHVLLSRHLQASPRHPQWPNRDRFVMSNGHACALLYSALHLLGYEGLGLDDLRAFRQLGSNTPGHPESHITAGVEVTTGPLGQGVANAVGLAAAERHLQATFGPEWFDHTTYVLLGDGCLQEGVASEACSLAGHWQLGKLILLWDDNSIQIDGSTQLAWAGENVMQRMAAYGFHTLHVPNGDSDLEAIDQAIQAAKQETARPSFLRITTTIGIHSRLAGTEKVHGAPLGAPDVAAVKQALGFDPALHFHVPPSVRVLYGGVIAERGNQLAALWYHRLAEQAGPAGEELKRRLAGELPAGLSLAALPRWTANDPPMATRKASETVLSALAPLLPELVGGSADLTHSNLTRWKGATTMGPAHLDKEASWAGRYIYYGVREHAMLAISNGLRAYGAGGGGHGGQPHSLLLPFAATFLNFITYGWGAVRLAALSHLQVIYIMTHDSIGLGEDGPTHQPIETLAALRALPHLLVFRPADGNETVGAYWQALLARDQPSVLALSRQNLPQLAGSSPEAVARGAYAIVDCEQPRLILLATGSEVQLAIQAAGQLSKVRVVSMPCWELFERQSLEYRQALLPSQVPRLALECLSSLGWHRYATETICLDQFGSSGPGSQVMAHYGFTVEQVVAKAQAMLSPP